MNGHAVRWPKRYRYKEVEYTKFHWTTDGGWTICGRNIVLLPEHCPVMPETSDYESDVDCSMCKRLLTQAADWLQSREEKR